MDAAAGLPVPQQRELAAFLVRLKRTADALEAALRASDRIARSRRQRAGRRARPPRGRAA